MSEEEAADRLYAVPPARFVAARDEAVAEARAAGDGATAAALARLRKPTVAAWLVNLLALRRPELLASLADLAATLQQAQRELRGDQLRGLAPQRRAAVSALVATARSLAIMVDPSVAHAKLPLSEVEATLHATLADERVAEAVRCGRLLKAVTYAGFGELPKPQLRLVTGAPMARPAVAVSIPDRAAVEAELVEARAEVAAAEAELARAVAARREAGQALAEIDAALAELAARRERAAARAEECEAIGISTRRAVHEARRRVGVAQAAVEAMEENIGPRQNH